MNAETTYRRAATACAIAAALIGGLVLAGHLAGNSDLENLFWKLPAMRPGAALSIVLAAFALLLITGEPVSRRRRTAAVLLTCGVAVLALGSLIESTFAIPTSFEALICTHGSGNSPDHRTMPPSSSILLILLGFSLTLIDSPTRRWLAGWGFAAVATTVLLPTFGYLYGVPSFLDAPSEVVPLPGSLASLLLLCVGGFLARPDRGWMAVLRSETTGGVVARRLLPAAVIIPLMLGWVRLVARNLGLVSAEFATAAMVFLIVVLLAAVMIATSTLLDRGDRQRRAAEDALARSEAILRQTQEISHVGGWDYDVVNDRLTWTEEVYRIYDLPIDREGKDVPSALSYYTPESRERLSAAFERALREGEPYDLEVELVTARQRPIWVRTVGRAEVQDGRIVRVYGNIVDITDRRRAHEATARLAAIVESTPDAVIGKTLDGTIVSWNRGAEAVYGYSAEEMIGQHVTMLALPDRVEEIYQILRTVRQDLSVIRSETVRRTKLGKTIHVALTVSPILNAAGRIVGISTIARDITDRREAEERIRQAMAELERSNRELEQFAYVASHDLQEPLRMVASYTQLLGRRYADKLDQDAREFIDYAVDGANRMQRLINDLLMYSRVGTRGRPLEPVDSHLALGRAISNLRALAEETGAMITNDDLPPVLADEGQLVQLFQNLLGNAMKFRREGVPPRIHVAAGRDGDRWSFSVRDNGIGIEPEFHSRVFVIFQRLHPRDVYPGTGIGLAICKRIVERHGGEIWIESHPGEGSTFHFTLTAVAVTPEVVHAH